jgi:hypothetical protein
MNVLPTDFKKKVVAAILDQRARYEGSDSAFAKSLGVSGSIFNRMKKGETDSLVTFAKWLMLGREFDINLNERKWKTARTEVFNIIEEDVLFCQAYSKARICVDDCGIGKTYTARYLSKSLKNCFYVDASQSKTKVQFIKALAKTVGTENKGRFADVKENLKYHIKALTCPVIIIDEAGDLEYNAFLELKELWNSTEHACGWYMMGADGLRAKIERGIENKKVGFREIFSRYSEKYTTITPAEKNERQNFYIKMIMDVLMINGCEQDDAKAIAKRCLNNDNSGHVSGLRRAESLLILNKMTEDDKPKKPEAKA